VSPGGVGAWVGLGQPALAACIEKGRACKSCSLSSQQRWEALLAPVSACQRCEHQDGRSFTGCTCAPPLMPLCPPTSLSVSQAIAERGAPQGGPLPSPPAPALQRSGPPRLESTAGAVEVQGYAGVVEVLPPSSRTSPEGIGIVRQVQVCIACLAGAVTCRPVA